MKRATFRFYAELNDFLPAGRRGKEFEYAFRGSPGIKDTIEALGVPHTEVDLILIDRESVDFTYRLRDGDRASVYPVFETFDIAPLVRLRPEPLREPRFILDGHLGRLAAYLRLLGFDALYRNDYTDEELARISLGERRILLTRDRGLLKRSAVTHGTFVRNTHPRRQVVEVMARFDLLRRIRPFSRCMRCNTVLERASPGRGPRAAEWERVEMTSCPGCGRLYWRGSHYDPLRRFIDTVIEEAEAEARSPGWPDVTERPCPGRTKGAE